MNELAKLAPKAFCEALQTLNIDRFYFVWSAETATLYASHPELEPLGQDIAARHRDFDKHEAIFMQRSPRTGILQGAFIHRTCRGQAAGGIRYWTYDAMADFFSDGLRLAKGMTQKNALAGLWWGGGKGVMAQGTEGINAPADRTLVYEDYGEFLSSLRGCYIGAEDAGTTAEDMARVFARTRFTTCIPELVGGSGNPSVPTARGVVRGMEAALAFREQGDLSGKTVAIQGLGHVGRALVGFLHERGVSKIFASDMSPQVGAELKLKYPDLEFEFSAVGRNDQSLLELPVDILSLNAAGGGLNEASIPRIAAPIVCGAANNQLQDPELDDQRLAERGILYVPDFLVNRMGIVCCADEANGGFAHDPSIERHLGTTWENAIYPLALRIFQTAVLEETTPQRVAVALANRLSDELHPIMGHRGRQIIDALVKSGWEQKDA